jgi:large subunit ribosomal protein L11
VAKKVKTILKLNLPAGAANPAPPVGTALGPQGINIMEFCNAYNEKTKDRRGEIVPAVITVYEDRTFTFELKKAPVAEYIKKKIGIKSGSGEPNKKKVGKLTQQQLTEIAQEKLDDFNTTDLEAAKKTVAGTARSMGVEVK